jgi:pyruvate dehydrogenase E2 component (dihydrolipoamide acetyltransferase)
MEPLGTVDVKGLSLRPAGGSQAHLSPPRHRVPERLLGWRRIAAAVWHGPNDPQIFGTLEVDATPLVALMHAYRRAGHAVTLTHLVGRALALALAKVPDVNVRLTGGKAVPHPTVDVFFITAVEGGHDLSGVKIVDADLKSALQIADELGQRAHVLKSGQDVAFERSKRLMNRLPIPILRPMLRWLSWFVGARGRPLRMLGVEASPFGSAMVSSVGMFGLPNGFSPLAWLYQVPILVLVGERVDKPWAVKGQVEVRPVMPISVSLDHRYMDGWHIGRITAAFREYFAAPEHFEPPIELNA